MAQRGARRGKPADSISPISYGSVLDDLDIAPGNLASFKLRAELHSNIIKVASRYSQAELQELLNESQPRVSDFLRGKVTKFSLETLVEYAERLGMPANQDRVAQEPQRDARVGERYTSAVGLTFCLRSR